MFVKVVKLFFMAVVVSALLVFGVFIVHFFLQTFFSDGIYRPNERLAIAGNLTARVSYDKLVALGATSPLDPEEISEITDDVIWVDFREFPARVFPVLVHKDSLDWKGIMEDGKGIKERNKEESVYPYAVVCGGEVIKVSVTGRISYQDVKSFKRSDYVLLKRQREKQRQMDKEPESTRAEPGAEEASRQPLRAISLTKPGAGAS